MVPGAEERLDSRWPDIASGLDRQAQATARAGSQRDDSGGQFAQDGQARPPHAPCQCERGGSSLGEDGAHTDPLEDGGGESREA